MFNVPKFLELSSPFICNKYTFTNISALILPSFQFILSSSFLFLFCLSYSFSIFLFLNLSVSYSCSFFLFLTLALSFCFLLLLFLSVSYSSLLFLFLTLSLPPTHSRRKLNGKIDHPSFLPFNSVSFFLLLLLSSFPPLSLSLSFLFLMFTFCRLLSKAETAYSSSYC